MCLKVDKDLNVVSKVDFTFKNPQFLIWKGVFDNTGDFAAIFAPTAGMGIKDESEKPTEYTYVRINPKGEIVERVPFETKATRWMIGGVYDKDGITTIYGAGFKIGKPKDAFADFKNYAPVYKGFDNMQVVSIKGGKVQYVAAPNLDEIASKTVAPSGQKKAKEYDGGRIRVTGIETAPNGDVMIMAQMLTYNAVSQMVIYKDFMVFHFGSRWRFQENVQH
jgi:hypothetical protein